MFLAIRAGALYAIMAFLIGFFLGTIRVLLLLRCLSETVAVIVEVPIMSIATWWLCRWCVDRVDMPRAVPVRLLMGAVAFLVLMAAEFATGLVFGRSLAEQLAAFGSIAGAIGLAAQIVFVLFPVVQVWRR